MSRKTASPDTWQRLTQPHPSLGHTLERRQARALAGLSLVLFVVAVLVIAVIGVAQHGDPVYMHSLGHSAPVLALLALAYGLSRTSRPQVGALVLVAGLLVYDLIVIATTDSPTLAGRALALIAVPVVLSALLLGWRATLTSALLGVGGSLVMLLVLPWLSPSDLWITILFVALISALAVGTAISRERNIGLLSQQTQELDAYHLDLERQAGQRARRITAAAEVAQTIAGTRSLDALLKRVVNLITERFGYLHAQVFLLDETDRFAVLRASTGQVGREMLARGHRLTVGSPSIIGQVAERGEMIVAREADAEAAGQRDSMLPDVRSEIAFPLRVGSRVIGVLDIQTAASGALAASDVPILQTIASQLAIAVENARLFEQAEHNLHEIRALNRVLTGEGWRDYFDQHEGGVSGYEADEDGLRPLSTDKETTDAPDGALSLPISLHGSTIGQLEVVPGEDEPDSQAQAVLEAVAERIALALDNTRLIEQSRRAAWREQIINRVSTEIQRVSDLRSVLRVAVTELSRAFDAPRGFIELVADDDQDETVAKGASR
jgi:GAF domain-containing protein